MPLPVHKACMIGNRSVLKKILHSVSLQTLEAKDEFGRTPLMYCVMHNHVECANLLLKSGVHVENSDNSGQTALHIAANKGFHRCTKLLLQHNASCQQKDFYGVSPLHLAAVNSNHKGLSYILKIMKPSEIDIQDSSKKTALHWCCAHSNVQNTKLLLMKGANICIPDEDGKTPLHFAVMNANPQALECVKVLLAKEKSLVGWQDYLGRSALHLAVATGSLEVVRFLACRDDSNIDILDNSFCTPLHWAARKGLHDKVDILLNQRASSTSADDNGATPLHYAAFFNHAKTVAIFLSRNYVFDVGDNVGRNSLMWAAAQNAVDVLGIFATTADLQYVDNDGMSALHVAARQGQVSAVEFLLMHKVSINIEDKYGMTPFLRACEAGRTGTAQTLISHGADIHIRDVHKCTALHWCTLGGHAYLCQILLSKGAYDLDAQDEFGMTPLHYACMKEGSLNCVSVLLESDSNTNILDMEGKTPLHYAISSANRNIVRLLCEYGANVNSLIRKKKCWTTPLDLAILKNNTEIIQTLRSNGGLKMDEIMEIAASKIQSWYNTGFIIGRKKNLCSKEKSQTYVNTSLHTSSGANLAFLKRCKDVVDAYHIPPFKDGNEISKELKYSLSTMNVYTNFKKFDLYQERDSYNFKTLRNYDYSSEISLCVEMTAAFVIQRFLRKCAIKRKFQRMRRKIETDLTIEKRVYAEQSWNLKVLSFYNQL